MKVKDLLAVWEHSASEPRTEREYRVRLSIHDAAKLAALCEMYPGRSQQDIITDLLASALDEVEAGLPYVEGTRVVAEDEHGDPVFEDAGPTPRFAKLQRKHLDRLRHQN